MVNCPDTSFKRIILFISEKCAFLCKLHAIDHFSALFVCEYICCFIARRFFHGLMIIFVQQFKRKIIPFDHRQHLLRVQTFFYTLHDLYHFSQLTDTVMVDSIAF